MSDQIIPTDSILRRHFEQQAACLGLGTIPEDSILRRHYLQALSSQGQTAPSQAASARVTAQAAAPAAARQTALC